MSTGKWAQRLRDFQNNPRSGTPKTPETPLLGVLGAGVGGSARKTEGQCCDRCHHMSRSRTCLEPVAAGVAGHFHIVWCDLLNGHGRTCPAYAPKGAPRAEAIQGGTAQ